MQVINSFQKKINSWPLLRPFPPSGLPMEPADVRGEDLGADGDCPEPAVALLPGPDEPAAPDGSPIRASNELDPGDGSTPGRTADAAVTPGDVDLAGARAPGGSAALYNIAWDQASQMFHSLPKTPQQALCRARSLRPRPQRLAPLRPLRPPPRLDSPPLQRAYPAAEPSPTDSAASSGGAPPRLAP